MTEKSTHYYFTYGSNMDKEDLDAWSKDKGLPDVTFRNASPARLTGYRLCFNYFSTGRGGGAANIMKSSNDSVYGLLVKIGDSELEAIRIKEGHPRYYYEICVDIEKLDGTVVKDVKTYKVVKDREKPDHQPPTRYYLQLIIKNARKYGFPSEYIAFLESITTKE